MKTIATLRISPHFRNQVNNSLSRQIIYAKIQDLLVDLKAGAHESEVPECLLLVTLLPFPQRTTSLNLMSVFLMHSFILLVHIQALAEKSHFLLHNLNMPYMVSYCTISSAKIFFSQHYMRFASMSTCSCISFIFLVA